MSDRTYAIVEASTTNYDSATFLRRLYRLDDVPVTGTFTVDARRLRTPMDVTREQLGELLDTAFVDPDERVAMRAITPPGEIQPTREDVEGVTRPVLDRLHRFTRLWKSTPWSVPELDRVLTELAAGEGVLPLPDVATLVDIGRRHRFTADELCGLVGSLPSTLFDALFNTMHLARTAADRWDASTFVHRFVPPSRGGVFDRVLARVLAGLRIDLRALDALVGSAGEVTLDRGELARWYQHARLAAVYRIDVPTLLGVLAVMGGATARLAGASALAARVELLDRWQRLATPLADATALLRTTADAADIARAAALVDVAAARDLVAFPDTTFAIAGVTEEVSRRIVQLNAGAYSVPAGVDATRPVIPADVASALGVSTPEAVSATVGAWLAAHQQPAVGAFAEADLVGIGGLTLAHVRDVAAANATLFVAHAQLVTRRADGQYVLAPSFAPAATPLVPPDQPLTTAAVAAHLERFHPASVLPALLGESVGVLERGVRALLALAGFDLAAGVTRESIATAFATRAPDATLHELVAVIARLAHVFRGFDAAVLERVASTPMLAISDYRALAITDLELVARYRQLRRAASDDPTAIDDAIVELRGGLPSAATTTRLAVLAGVAPAVIASLASSLALGAEPVAALAKLLECAALARDLRVGGDVLVALAGSDHDAVGRAADAIAAGLHGDDPAAERRRDDAEDAVRERKRDALVDYVLHTHAPDRFDGAGDLYHWFLIDTQVQGCARTSRLVAATASLQLYVQRCLMRLERGPGDAVIAPAQRAVEQWEWRKNYRVWEAARRVFLYPESYLRQALRDDKSELFARHEEQLLAQHVDEHRVLETYGAYLSDFTELVDLRVSGAYHDQADGRDVLHVFACNRGNPPDHWYRTIENVYAFERGDAKRVIYHPWRKVSIQIPVRDVSPVVHDGRLYVFWIESTTKVDNDTSTGRSRFVGYKHDLAIRFSGLRLDGTWLPPQPLQSDDHLAHVVPDRLDDSEERVAALPGFIFRRISTNTVVFGSQTLLTSAIEALRKLFKDAPHALDAAGLQLSLDDYTFQVDPGARAVRALFVPQHEALVATVPVWQLHIDARDDYHLEGWQWTRAYPHANGELRLRWRDGQKLGQVDLFARELRALTPSGGAPAVEPRLFYQFAGDTNTVYRGLTRTVDRDAPYEEAQRLVHREPYDSALDDHRAIITNAGLGELEMNVVNGALGDGIIDVDGQLLYLHTVPEADLYALKRLDSTLAVPMRKALFEHGVDRLLAAEHQAELVESAPPLIFRGVTPDGRDGEIFDDASAASRLGMPDFKGSLGTYFREVFLHLPWRIAEHLNAQQEFELAHRWFRYILDPTSTVDLEVPAGATAEERQRLERGRIWQYIEFRRHELASLRAQLLDTEAIDVHAGDPFNPHAIARLRLGAYMRGVWMRMIENLLDWGDHLFTGDTRESINEATLLYVMASDLLGPRPDELGDCREEPVLADSSYERLLARMRACPSEPVAAVESAATPAPRATGGGTISPQLVDRVKEQVREELGAGHGRSPTLGWHVGITNPLGRIASFTSSLLSQACVFCIPPNPELLALWDRVEDRLFKIRNCMTIKGVRRELALFSAPIDPALLVRARAAGVSLDDLLDATAGNLPPYRFGFLIAKAKEYAGAVQGFGGALLAAIERKDGEELARLRMVHEKNVLALTTRLRDQEVEAAEEMLESLIRRRDTVTRRRDHQQMLIEQGLSGWEAAQLHTKRAATIALSIPPALELVSATLELIPKIVGTAASTGGHEAARSMKGFGQAARAAAEQTLRISDALGLEASFERRLQGWELQLELADLELRELESQIAAQTIRVEMARRAREIHERNRAQLDETMEYFQSKFSNLALYEYLATTMQRLHRQAYEHAYELVRLAEHAYQFERNESGPVLAGGHWDGGRAGLLAGEKLMADIRELEHRFMTTHHRGMEIDQAFSIAQIDPRALWELKQTGECEVTIPELFFDLYYPGQYRRRVRSARLTIPSITGPHTNVSATLTLVSSSLRKTPHEPPTPVPPTRAVTIATSSAQNDAGMFQVDFRDERYMPFEGAGAVDSRWRITLPKNFRPFDYATINDVLLHLSYTAEYDAAYARRVEAANGSLMQTLGGVALPRAISLRQELSSTFHRLLHSPAGTAATFELSERHFPLFLQGRALRISRAWLLVEPDLDAFLDDAGNRPASITYPTFRFSRDATATADLALTETLGGLRAVSFVPPGTSNLDVRRDAAHFAITVANAGDFAPASPAPSDPSAFDAHRLRDVILYLEYTVAP